MLKIKLRSNGKIHQRSFRIVVAPARSKSNGKFIDDLGFYTPQTKTFQIDKEKMVQWLKNGAQLTEGVDKLLNPDKYPRIKKVKKTKKTKDVIEKNEKIKEINQDNPQSTTTKPLDSSKVNEQENTKKEVKENEIEKKEIENIENNKEKTEVVKEVEAK